jgi:hypothetical protein
LSILCFPTQAFAKAKIQIAILLDSSNSMDGLIDQARTQLWQIVNSLTKVTKDGKVPQLEVGQQRQATEDSNSGRNGVMRGVSKASQYYQKFSWALVDALDRGIVVLERLSADALPLAMRGRSLAPPAPAVLRQMKQ